MQVEEPEGVLDESLSLASLAIPPLPDFVTGDEEWGTPEPARVYLNGPGSLNGRIEVIGTGFETQAESQFQIPPEGLLEGLISYPGARFALNVASGQGALLRRRVKRTKRRRRVERRRERGRCRKQVKEDEDVN